VIWDEETGGPGERCADCPEYFLQLSKISSLQPGKKNQPNLSPTSKIKIECNLETSVLNGVKQQ
jgi:hypothetical protein